jgi:hypothetical protein
LTPRNNSTPGAVPKDNIECWRASPGLSNRGCKIREAAGQQAKIAKLVTPVTLYNTGHHIDLAAKRNSANPQISTVQATQL